MSGIEERKLEKFRNDVIEFSIVDTSLKKLRKEIEPLRTNLRLMTEKKKEIQREIALFMMSNEIDICNLPKDVDESKALKYYFTETKKAITHDYIKQCLDSFFENAVDKSPEFTSLKPIEKSDFLYNYLQEHRPKKINQNLRKVKSVNIEEINEEYRILGG